MAGERPGPQELAARDIDCCDTPLVTGCIQDASIQLGLAVNIDQTLNFGTPLGNGQRDVPGNFTVYRLNRDDPAAFQADITVAARQYR